MAAQRAAVELPYVYHGHSVVRSITGLQVYLSYRIRDDLVEIHVEGPSGFRSLFADWVERGSAQQKASYVSYEA